MQQIPAGRAQIGLDGQQPVTPVGEAAGRDLHMGIALPGLAVQAQHDLARRQAEPFQQLLEDLAVVLGDGADMSRVHVHRQPRMGIMSLIHVMQGVADPQQAIEKDHLLRIPGMHIERLGAKPMPAGAFDPTLGAEPDQGTVPGAHDRHLIEPYFFRR